MSATIHLHPAWLSRKSLFEIVVESFDNGLQLNNRRSKSGRHMICLEPIEWRNREYMRWRNGKDEHLVTVTRHRAVDENSGPKEAG